MTPLAAVLPLLPLLLVLGSAVLGGAVQSVLGFGAAFTLVPALAVVAPDLLPGAAIVAFLPLSALMVLRERGTLDRVAARRLVLSRIPGTVLGTIAVLVLPVRGLAGVVAVLLLLAVVSAAAGWQLTPTRRTEVAAGVTSGFAGTAVGLGGPPLALLYRGRHSSEIRPTLAAVFTIGIMISLLTLGATGAIDLPDVQAGGLLALANVVGLVGAAPLLRHIPEPTIRAGLLVWAGIGAVLALVRVVLG